jgi:hemoglobin-like flavoprotein
MDSQMVMLKNSLALVVMYGSRSEYALGFVTELAERHGSRSLDIKPHLYEFWLESLMRAIERHDPNFSESLDKTWRQLLRAPIEFMKANY